MASSSYSVMVGRQDKDYQKLRSQKASAADDEDDPNAPESLSKVTPASPGINQLGN